MAKQCVLLVEDNPDDVTLITRQLKKVDERLELVVAPTGEDAFKLFMGSGRFSKRGGRQKPLFILLDLHLPKIGGFVLLELFKQELKDRHIPIVVITASHEQTEEMDSLSLGASDFIQKPLQAEELRNLIGKYRIIARNRTWFPLHLG